MVYIDVSLNQSRLISAPDCILLAQAPSLTPSSEEGICDICSYTGDKSPKQVKEAYGVIVCRLCYLSIKEMNQDE